MGSGGSKSYQQSSRSVEVAQRRRRMVEQVERFVVNVYASCSRVEAMWLILSSKLGQKAFENFVRLEESDAVLGIFLATSDVLSHPDITWDAALSHIQLLQPQLTDPDSPVADLLPILFRNEFLEDFSTMDGAGNPKLILALLQRLQNELVLIMARDLFNRFIMSKHYKTWRAAEASHAIATTVQDTSLPTTEPATIAQTQLSSDNIHSAVSNKSQATTAPPPKKHNSRNNNIRSSVLRRSLSRLSVTRMSQGTMLRFRMRSVVAPQDLSTSAFSQMKGDELQTLLRRRENWLASLVAAVEALPVAFCLASCNRPSRPLIFVNKFFEKTTGFNRDDIMGRSLGDVLLLHTSGAMHSHGLTITDNTKATEDARTRQLREALQQGKTNVSVLDNKTADDKDFKCLSVIKPVFSVTVDEHRLFCGADNNLNMALLTNNATSTNSNSTSNITSSSGINSLQPLYIMALLFDVTREVDNFVSKSALASDLMALLPDVLLASEDDVDEDDEDNDSNANNSYSNNSGLFGRSGSIINSTKNERLARNSTACVIC